MPSLFCKVHRLKARKGWTWDHFLYRIELLAPGGMDEKTLYALYRYPHRKATRHVTHILEKLHEQCFPSPFPDDVEALMRVYNNLQACRRHGSREGDIADLACFLQGQLQQPDGGGFLRTARLNWLLANIHFDRLSALRDHGRHESLVSAQQLAIDHYRQALDLIISHQQRQNLPWVSEFNGYKLRQNILACHLNVLAPGQRYNDPEVLAYVERSYFLQNSKSVLNQEPWLWMVARNGLRFASLMKKTDDCRWFFIALVKASRFFADLDYRPPNYPAIADSEEFAWAVDHVLTEDFLKTFKDKR